MNLTRTFAVLLSISSAAGLSQLASSPQSNKFSTMTMEQAEQTIREPLTGVEALELIDAVLESGRLDLVEIAWVRLGARMRDNVDRLPSSRFKENVLLLMLKTDSAYWPDTITYGSRGIIPDAKPFTPLIQKYLPDVKPTIELLQDRQARLRLVAQVEHARGAEAAAGRSEEAQPEAPRPSAPPLSPLNPSAASTTSSKSLTALASKDASDTDLWIWVAVAFGAFGAAAVLLALRHRQKQGRPR